MPDTPTRSNQSPPFRAGRAAALFIVMFCLAVPWWWNWFPEEGNRIRFGAPTWAVTAVVGAFLLSCTIVWCLQRAWDTEEQNSAPDHSSEPHSRSTGDQQEFPA